MLTQLVKDNPRLKLARRYVLATNGLLKILGVPALPNDLDDITLPKGHPQRREFIAGRKVRQQCLAASKSLGISLPSDAECQNEATAVRDLNRALRQEEPVPDDECREVGSEEYKGFEIKVFERLDLGETKQRFTPIVLKDGAVVRRFFIRCPKLGGQEADYVPKRYARRAIDHLLTTGEWPAKQGATITPVVD